MLNWMKLKQNNHFKLISFSFITIFIALVAFYAGMHMNKNKVMDKVPKVLAENTTPKVEPKQEEKWVKIENRIKRGDTIIELLKNEGVDHLAAYAFFMEVKPVYDLRRIGAGKKYTLYLSKDKREIQRFIYEIDREDYLEVTRNQKSISNHPDVSATSANINPSAEKEEDVEDVTYTTKLVAIPYTKRKVKVSGRIQESLFAAISKCGEKAELADMMASLYDYDVDFNRDIRKNDSFSLLVEKLYLKGEFVRYGEILAAEFVNQGKSIQVVRYTDPEGHTAYYHPDGRSVRKMFLRCPLPFMRVTSRYGNRRHPVLGYSALHRGIDLGAPIGTQVRATASGTIKSTGYDNIRGRYIMIQHKNRYITQYFHLNGYYKGIKRGARVLQGQVIGYVGKTGRSTGPHLHYGLKKGNGYVNPLNLKSPTKEPVKKEFLVAFKSYSERLLQQISFHLPQRLPAIPTSPYFIH